MKPSKVTIHTQNTQLADALLDFLASGDALESFLLSPEYQRYLEDGGEDIETVPDVEFDENYGEDVSRSHTVNVKMEPLAGHQTDEDAL